MHPAALRTAQRFLFMAKGGGSANDLPVPANEGCSGLEAHLGRSDALVKALLNPKKLEAFITEKLCGSDRLRG